MAIPQLTTEQLKAARAAAAEARRSRAALKARVRSGELTLAQALDVPRPVVWEALDELRTFYDETGRGFELRRVGAGYATELLRTPPVNRHRPSVDVLFDSAAAAAKSRASPRSTTR